MSLLVGPVAEVPVEQEGHSPQKRQNSLPALGFQVAQGASVFSLLRLLARQKKRKGLGLLSSDTKVFWNWRETSAGKLLVNQSWGPDFKPQYPRKGQRWWWDEAKCDSSTMQGGATGVSLRPASLASIGERTTSEEWHLRLIYGLHIHGYTHCLKKGDINWPITNKTLSVFCSEMLRTTPCFSRNIAIVYFKIPGAASSIF